MRGETAGAVQGGRPPSARGWRALDPTRPTGGRIQGGVRSRGPRASDCRSGPSRCASPEELKGASRRVGGPVERALPLAARDVRGTHGTQWGTLAATPDSSDQLEAPRTPEAGGLMVVRSESREMNRRAATTWTRSSRAPSPPTCPLNSPRVRARDQPQDCQSARAHDPAVGTRAGGRGRPVMPPARFLQGRPPWRASPLGLAPEAPPQPTPPR